MQLILGDLKVCTYCSKIILSYLKSLDIDSDLKLDLQSLHDDLSNKLSTYNNAYQMPDQPSAQMHRKFSVGYQEERLVSHRKSSLSNSDRKNILQQSNSLKTLYDEMTKVLPNQNRGTDLLTYLIANQKSSNKIQATAIIIAMIEAGFLSPIIVSVHSSDEIEFNENCFYKLLRMDELMSNSGSFQLDLDLEASSVHLSRPNPDGSSLNDGNNSFECPVNNFIYNNFFIQILCCQIHKIIVLDFLHQKTLNYKILCYRLQAQNHLWKHFAIMKIYY